MLALCVVSLFSISNGCAMRMFPIFHGTQMHRTLDIDSSNSTNNINVNDVHVLNTKLTNGTMIPYNTFFSFLLNTSIWLLQNAQNNIVNNYDINPEDIKVIEAAFSSNKYEYQVILKNNLESVMKNVKYNSAEIFLLDFTDFSNYLLQTIIQNNLHYAKGKLLVPSKWNKHLLKYTILRQQTKIVINIIEVKICHKFSICVSKLEYSEYVVEWLRHLLNVKNAKLKSFTSLIPQLLNKQLNIVKSNIKFRQKSKDLAKAELIVQRSLIDFVDEVITEQAIMKTVPHELRKQVVLLKDLFTLIDENYDLNAANEKKLDDINKKFYLWAEGESIKIIEVLEEILKNMSINVQMWSNDSQSKLENTWSKILHI